MKFLPNVFSINSKIVAGQLNIADCKVSSLAKEFGTPLFIIDENDFNYRLNAWKSALERHFGAQAGSVYYASKSFISVEVAKWISSSGIGIDVCTAGELAVALAANFDPSKIELHGNNKSEIEIRAAIKAGVSKIVIDSHQEIERVNRLANEAGIIQNVLIRLTPGVEAHTHEFISTAHEDVKFGFSISSGDAAKAAQGVEQAANLRLNGVHCHIGSQIFESEGFEMAATRLIEFLSEFRDRNGRELAELDLGGGYGVAYVEGEITYDPDVAMSAIASLVKVQTTKHKLAMPVVSIEPGRAISAPTTTTLYEVGTTKNVTLDDGGIRRYIAVDGGMSDNIRPALYGAQYSAILANRTSTQSAISSRLVGKHCESGDIIIREIDLPSDIAPGDLIATPATGAYGRSMASNYNHMPRPAVIAVKDGTARLIVRRETQEDLLGLDVSEQPRTIN